jgi:hypothetical protein
MQGEEKRIPPAQEMKETVEGLVCTHRITSDPAVYVVAIVAALAAGIAAIGYMEGLVG